LVLNLDILGRSEVTMPGEDADMVMVETTEPAEDAADQDIHGMEIAVGPSIALQEHLAVDLALGAKEGGGKTTLT
jgi:hypothetical protein